MFPHSHVMGRGINGAIPSYVWDAAFNNAVTYSNSDKTATTNNITTRNIRSTIGKSAGKWYTETVIDSMTGGQAALFIANSVFPNNFVPGDDTDCVAYLQTGVVRYNATTLATLGALADGDLFMSAFDKVAGKAWFGRNGTWGSGDPASGAGGYTLPTGTLYVGGNVRGSQFTVPNLLIQLPAGFGVL